MSVLGKTWKIKNEDKTTSLLSRLLSNRGLKNETDIDAFFNPTAERDFHDPFLMKDMQHAVDRIATAIEKNERIMIFGDYDVDGITGTTILMRTLRKLGANVSCRLPHRIEDGYGLRKKFIDEFKTLEVKLAITVDNGISCFNEVEHANTLGIDVIITDHHSVPEKIPNAYAILHPKLPGSGYPFSELTGAGVALKLAQALFMKRTERHEEETAYLLDLACMGTIADLGELRGENRYIVKNGLRALENTRWPGLSRLKESAGIRGKVSTYDIGFLLSPRINAAGRISHPQDALKLLLHDQNHGRRLAENLERLNQKRQKMMHDCFEVAEKIAAKQSKDPIIIISDASFHGGIIGLLAAKLNEKYARPAVVMEERAETLVGSCRSITAVHIVECLKKVSHLLLNFGGHAMAAGFEIKKENLKTFTKEMKKIVGQTTSAQEFTPTINIECALKHDEISTSTVEMLRWFEPFGIGNEMPRFLCENLPVLEASHVGADKKHVKFITRVGSARVDCIAFKFGEHLSAICDAKNITAVCEIEEDSWHGRKKLQLKIIDFKLR